jgi:hypothetical protein
LLTVLGSHLLPTFLSLAVRFISIGVLTSMDQGLKHYVFQMKNMHLIVICANPASAFRHQGQTGTAGHGLVRHFPTLDLSLIVFELMALKEQQITYF